MDKDLDRPFSKEIWEQACDLATDYHIKIEPNKDLGFVACGAEFPHTFADGKTKEECKKNWFEALRANIATMLEMGSEFPKIIN